MLYKNAHPKLEFSFSEIFPCLLVKRNINSMALLNVVMNTADHFVGNTCPDVLTKRKFHEASRNACIQSLKSALRLVI